MRRHILALAALVAAAFASPGARADTDVSFLNGTGTAITLQVGRDAPFPYTSKMMWHHRLTTGQTLIVRTAEGRRLCGEVFVSPAGSSRLMLVVSVASWPKCDRVWNP